MGVIQPVVMHVTDRFMSTYRTSPFQDRVSEEIRDLHSYLTRRNSGQLGGWPINCKPILGLPDSLPPMREWRLSKRGRIIFTEENEPTLVDFSIQHDAVETFTRLKPHQIKSVLDKKEVIEGTDSWGLLEDSDANPEEQLEGSFQRETYVEEQFDDWLYFLDKEQLKVRDQVLSAVAQPLRHSVTLIMGGAGTGKTAILTNLTFELQRMGIEPILLAETGVRHYLSKSERYIPGLSANLDEATSKNVILVDDPLTFEAMLKSVKRAEELGVPVIVGIDPTQWHERRLAEKWERYESQGAYVAHYLFRNYRQGRLAGKPALDTTKNFFRKSSAFVAENKVLAEQQAMAAIRKKCLEEIRYVDDAGGFAIHEAPFKHDLFLEELSVISAHESAKSWPKLLVGVELAILKSELRATLESYVDRGLTFHLRDFSSIADVRGTEYDFVILLTPEAQWHAIEQGTMGAGTDEWVSLNKTLTFLSRAKNHFSVYKTDELWFGGLKR